jgi:hypothetical protein
VLTLDYLPDSTEVYTITPITDQSDFHLKTNFDDRSAFGTAIIKIGF